DDGNVERERKIAGNPSCFLRHFAFRAVEVIWQTNYESDGIKVREYLFDLQEKLFPTRSFDGFQWARRKLQFIRDGNADAFCTEVERNETPALGNAKNI